MWPSLSTFWFPVRKHLKHGIGLSIHCLEISPYKNADTENQKPDKFYRFQPASFIKEEYEEDVLCMHFLSVDDPREKT